MKIGIFGDSFADDRTLWVEHFKDVGPSWIDYLRDQNIEIDNYAFGGSGLYFSYEKFISNFQKYDKIIFLVTSPGRISLPDKDGKYSHWYGPAMVEKDLATCFDYNKKVRLNAVRDYFMYVKNDKFDNLVHDLLIENISKKHDSMLMIPSFIYSRIRSSMPFIKISEFEAAFWNLKDVLPHSLGLQDARKCHMCEENNLMVGEEVFNWVKTDKFNLDPKKFNIPTREFDYYFRKQPW
jgi:hypothetical protein